MCAWDRSTKFTQQACEARTRSGGRCRTRAMANGRCRMHGGTNEGGKPGNANAWKHGAYSAEVQATRLWIRECATQIAMIRAALVSPRSEE